MGIRLNNNAEKLEIRLWNLRSSCQCHGFVEYNISCEIFRQEMSWIPQGRQIMKIKVSFAFTRPT